MGHFLAGQNGREHDVSKSWFPRRCRHRDPGSREKEGLWLHTPETHDSDLELQRPCDQAPCSVSLLDDHSAGWPVVGGLRSWALQRGRLGLRTRAGSKASSPRAGQPWRAECQSLCLRYGAGPVSQRDLVRRTSTEEAMCSCHSRHWPYKLGLNFCLLTVGPGGKSLTLVKPPFPHLWAGTTHLPRGAWRGPHKAGSHGVLGTP